MKYFVLSQTILILASQNYLHVLFDLSLKDHISTLIENDWISKTFHAVFLNMQLLRIIFVWNKVYEDAIMQYMLLTRGEEI